MPHGAATVALATSICLACLALPACVDLFHSTNFETVCEADAAACARVDASLCGDPSDPSTLGDVGDVGDACVPARGAEAGRD